MVINMKINIVKFSWVGREGCVDLEGVGGWGFIMIKIYMKFLKN